MEPTPIIIIIVGPGETRGWIRILQLLNPPSSSPLTLSHIPPHAATTATLPQFGPSKHADKTDMACFGIWHGMAWHGRGAFTMPGPDTTPCPTPTTPPPAVEMKIYLIIIDDGVVGPCHALSSCFIHLFYHQLNHAWRK